MGAFLAVTLTGSDDQGETKTGLDAPSYRFSLSMRRVQRAGTVQTMQSWNISVVKATGDLCSLDLSFNSMSALLVISSTLLSEASVVLDQPEVRHELVRLAAAMETSDHFSPAPLATSKAVRSVDSFFPFGWISQDEQCKTYLLAFAAGAGKSGADGGTRFHLRACGLWRWGSSRWNQCVIDLASHRPFKRIVSLEVLMIKSLLKIKIHGLVGSKTMKQMGEHVYDSWGWQKNEMIPLPGMFRDFVGILFIGKMAAPLRWWP